MAMSYTNLRFKLGFHYHVLYQSLIELEFVSYTSLLSIYDLNYGFESKLRFCGTEKTKSFNTCQ